MRLKAIMELAYKLRKAFFEAADAFYEKQMKAIAWEETEQLRLIMC